MTIESQIVSILHDIQKQVGEQGTLLQAVKDSIPDCRDCEAAQILNPLVPRLVAVEKHVTDESQKHWFNQGRKSVMLALAGVALFAWNAISSVVVEWAKTNWFHPG